MYGFMHECMYVLYRNIGRSYRNRQIFFKLFQSQLFFKSISTHKKKSQGNQGTNWKTCVSQNHPTLPSCQSGSFAKTAILCHGKARGRKWKHSAISPQLLQGLPSGPQAFVDVDDYCLPTIQADVVEVSVSSCFWIKN